MSRSCPGKGGQLSGALQLANRRHERQDRGRGDPPDALNALQQLDGLTHWRLCLDQFIDLLFQTGNLALQYSQLLFEDRSHAAWCILCLELEVDSRRNELLSSPHQGLKSLDVLRSR